MAKVFGLPAVTSVAVTERFVSGAVKSATATAADGSVVTRTGSQLQGALGLKSMFVNSVNGDVGAALPGAVPAPAPAPAPSPGPPPAPAPAPPSNVKQRTVSLLTHAPVVVPAGAGYKVVGVVRPAKAHLKSWRQRLVDGQWRTVATDRTNAKGRYRFVVKKAGPAAAGTYRVLVVRKGVVVGVSPEFAVTIS
jgi:hypothetical protein